MSSISAQATLIDVQFGSNSPQASVQYSGGAVIGSAGDYWNYFLPYSGADTLYDTSGSVTGVTVTYSADGNWGLSAGTSNFAGTPYYNLMQSFLYTSGTPISLTFSGLTPGLSYHLYLYGQSDFNSPYFGGVVTANGQTLVALQDTYSTFVNGGNYVEFTGTVDVNGEVTVSDAVYPGRYQTMVNGVQLEAGTVPIPEPSTYALLTCALAGLSLVSLRRSPKACRA